MSSILEIQVMNGCGRATVKARSIASSHDEALADVTSVLDWLGAGKDPVIRVAPEAEQISDFGSRPWKGYVRFMVKTDGAAA